MLEQGTAAWHKAREGRITGSRVAAVLGCSPFYSSDTALMREMVSEALGEKRDFDNEPMRWGRDHEEEAVKLYEFLYASGEEPVQTTGFWTDGGKMLGASPDRLVGEYGLLEVKCPWGLRDEKVPQFKGIEDRKDYWHQIQMQLHVTDRQWCDFFQWTPHGHNCVRVDRQESWLDDNLEVIEAFFKRYQSAVVKADKGGPQERVGGSARWAAACDLWAHGKRSVDAGQADMDDAKTVMMELMKNADIEVCAGFGVEAKVSYRKGSVDYKAVVGEFMAPDQFDEEQYRRAPSKAFLVKEIKE
jgi:putative phage-type endonuclease